MDDNIVYACTPPPRASGHIVAASRPSTACYIGRGWPVVFQLCLTIVGIIRTVVDELHMNFSGRVRCITGSAVDRHLAAPCKIFLAAPGFYVQFKYTLYYLKKIVTTRLRPL